MVLSTSIKEANKKVSAVLALVNTDKQPNSNARKEGKGWKNVAEKCLIV